MKQVDAFLTSDGILHADHATARRHAEKRYNDEMTTTHRDLMSAGLSARDAFRATQFIEANFERIARAASLKCDACTVEDEREPIID